MDINLANVWSLLYQICTECFQTEYKIQFKHAALTSTLTCSICFTFFKINIIVSSIWDNHTIYPPQWIPEGIPICIKYLYIQSNLYIKYNKGNLKTRPLWTVVLYIQVQIISTIHQWEHETALYRLICYIGVPFNAGLTVPV